MHKNKNTRGSRVRVSVGIVEGLRKRFLRSRAVEEGLKKPTGAVRFKGSAVELEMSFSEGVKGA